MATGNDHVDNVYVVDTRMFGFPRFNSAYIVAGKEIALIDTGTASSNQAVRDAIKAHGFELADISYIIITHTHFDHTGNAGILLREMPRAMVLAHPAASEILMNPATRIASNRKDVGAKFTAKFGEALPVPSKRIQTLADGEIIDLGKGRELKVIYTPGHQIEHIALLDQKNQGLFIGDSPGLYLSDQDFLLILSPPRSDVERSMETLKMLLELPIKRLFLGHFGIWDKPQDLMRRSLEAMKIRSSILSEALDRKMPEQELIGRIIAAMGSGLHKVRANRGESLYQYITTELVASWAKAFQSRYS
jgi:glyoxylase-like metal-dependent hydrolase (beta-lactamase superfamily II)